MSASEKLKALEDYRSDLPWDAWAQIVAVVEAAESSWPDQARVKMDAALAALEEALE